MPRSAPVALLCQRRGATLLSRWRWPPLPRQPPPSQIRKPPPPLLIFFLPFDWLHEGLVPRRMPPLLHRHSSTAPTSPRSSQLRPPGTSCHGRGFFLMQCGNAVMCGTMASMVRFDSMDPTSGFAEATTIDPCRRAAASPSPLSRGGARGHEEVRPACSLGDRGLQFPLTTRRVTCRSRPTSCSRWCDPHRLRWKAHRVAARRIAVRHPQQCGSKTWFASWWAKAATTIDSGLFQPVVMSSQGKEDMLYLASACDMPPLGVYRCFSLTGIVFRGMLDHAVY